MTAEMGRRGFMELAGSTLILGTNGGIDPQLDTDAQELDDEPELYGLVLDASRPSPERIDAEWDTYRLVHLNPATGAKAYIDHTSNGWREIPMTIPTNQLNNVDTAQAISFFNHTFARPESPDTKNWDFTAADITKFNSEVELASTTVLESNQRGNYPPGGPATPGVAFRLTGTPSAGEGTAGYYTANNGLVAGEDTTDSFVEIRKGGTAKRVYREDWNGYNPKERVWANSRPVITRMPHLFYGGGDLKVNAMIHGEESSELRTLHTFTPDNVDDTFSDGPPIEQPNLPVRFESNGLTGGNLRANAAHYQFELSEAENRVNGESFESVSVSGTNWTPLIAWQKRTGWEMVNVKPLRIFAHADGNSSDAQVELQLGADVSGGTWRRPTHTSPSETAVEVNTGASLDTNGERRWPGYAVAGQGGQGGEAATENLDFNLPAEKTIVLAAKGVGGSATMSGVIAWEEYF